MAASCLVHYVPPDDATVRALILALQDSQNDVRSHAVDSLGDFGEYARPALPALMLTALQDTSTGLGSAAYDAIKQIEYRMPGRE